jgi:hypothetical protein
MAVGIALIVLLALALVAVVVRRLRADPCMAGFHEWGPWLPKELHHMSKPEEKVPWEHMCMAEQRFCARCGKNSELQRTCTPITKVIKAGAPGESAYGARE